MLITLFDCISIITMYSLSARWNHAVGIALSTIQAMGSQLIYWLI